MTEAHKLIEDEVVDLVSSLKEKYDQNGQDFKAYLEGLLYQRYNSYWDYIHVDTLLTLQKPMTNLPDEMIFIIYHQITELYFKLSLHDIRQVSDRKDNIDPAFFAERVRRVNAYFRNLTNSFEIMVDGMEKDQFLKFRMSLLPASGFQSAQYRMIEICATDFTRLVDKDYREHMSPDAGIDEKYSHVYWMAGATELTTKKQTLTLTQFERVYREKLKALAAEYQHKNLWAVYKSMSPADQQDPRLVEELRKLDYNVNVNWPLQHYKSAARYLQRDPKDIPATGGTNWQKYLPPRFQKRIFYPELWSPEELENWGRPSAESV
jgi:tryptophan 2,3-dioxygenase